MTDRPPGGARRDAPRGARRDADHAARPNVRRVGTLATMCVSVTMIVMDASIVNVALPTLARELGGATTSELQWIVDAYILSFAALLLSMGSLADRFGRRRLLVAGLVVFGVTSFAAAFATTPLGLIVGRATMGVGAAMIFPATLAILTDTFQDRRGRRLAIGAWAACSGLGVALGPVVGGWLLVHGPWSWIFLVNVPVVVVVLIGACTVTRESRAPVPEPIDLPGNAFVVVGLLALVWGLIEGPVRGWGSASVQIALWGGAAALAALAWWMRRATHPIIDPGLLARRTVAAGCLGIAVAFFGLFGFVFMVTQYFQFVRGHDPLAAGIRTLPFAAFILVGAGIAVIATARLGHRIASTAGLGLMAIGFAWATVDEPTTPYVILVGQMGFLGTGLGLVSATGTDAIMGSLGPGRFGIGSSINDTAREVAGTIGIAVMGSVFNDVYRAAIGPRLEGAPLPEAARDAIRDSIGAALIVVDRAGDLAGPEAAAAIRGPVHDAFTRGFHASSWLAAGLSAVGAIAVFGCMPRRRDPRWTTPPESDPAASANPTEAPDPHA